jgi:hypothetical protein
MGCSAIAVIGQVSQETENRLEETTQRSKTQSEVERYEETQREKWELEKVKGKVERE